MLIVLFVSVLLTISLPFMYHVLSKIRSEWGAYAVYIWGLILLLFIRVLGVSINVTPNDLTRVNITYKLAGLIGLVIFPQMANMRFLGPHAKIKGLVVNPIFEEIAFRGIVLQSLNQFEPLTQCIPHTGINAAILISAILFAFSHLLSYGVNLPSIKLSCSCFAGGLFLGYVSLTTQTLFWCILYHMLFNSIMVLRTPKDVLA